MGQTLSAPVTAKHSSTGSNDRLAFGQSAMQGWRVTMDDAHTSLLDVEEAPGTAFFAVYDGHGAKYCGDHLYGHIFADPAFGEKVFKTAIRNGFLETDRALHLDPDCNSESSGCTAITATITDKNILYVGNVGDSRAVLSRDGKAVAPSIDHKPANIDESARILFSGGYVENGRVNGLLATSRALGDFGFKSTDTTDPGEQIVIAVPDVVGHELADEDEFLVLACDVDKIRPPKIAEKTPLDTLCENTLDHCLAGAGALTVAGCDKMTMVVVAFLNGRMVEEWYEHVGRHVAVVKPADPPTKSSSIAGKDTVSAGMLKRLFSNQPRSTSAKTKK
ncbi:phosphatase 2C-like domain-containing protein [Linnemannia elongata]|nr:phosphatase 2C-like domain-containing protein [Linnemannia elongata]